MAIRPENHLQCYQTALRILSRRDHSVYEIRQKLHLKGYATAAIDTAVAECTRLSYLNDEKVARQFVRVFKQQGFGPFRINQKLKAKGIADQLIASVLTDYLVTEEQIGVCRQVLAKKIKGSPEDFKDSRSRDKLRRFLLNRGFSPEAIHQTIGGQWPFMNS